MKGTKEKVQELIDEDPSLKEILEDIIDVEIEKEDVEWKDVKEKASSGQWGRLIEKGVLVESDGVGFRVNDLEEVKDTIGYTEGVDYETPLDIDEDIDTSWSIWDKAAGLVGLILVFFGYRNEAAQKAIGDSIDLLLHPLYEFGLEYPMIVMILAVLTGLYSSYLQLYLMEWDWIKAQQKKVKAIQSELKEAQLSDDDEREKALQDEQKEVMSEQMKMFKMQFKPSVWIMVLTIPIFIWLFYNFSDRFGTNPVVDNMPVLVMPFKGEAAFNAQMFGFTGYLEVWLFWYILCSFGFGQMLRKVLGVNPTT